MGITIFDSFLKVILAYYFCGSYLNFRILFNYTLDSRQEHKFRISGKSLAKFFQRHVCHLVLENEMNSKLGESNKWLGRDGGEIRLSYDCESIF